MVFGVSTNPLLTSNKNNILVSNLIAVTIILWSRFELGSANKKNWNFFSGLPGLYHA